MSYFKQLNRISFGPKQVEINHLKEVGWEAFVDEQLNPGEEPAELEPLMKETAYHWKVSYASDDRPPQRLKAYFEPGRETYRRIWQSGKTPEKIDIRLPFYETIIVSWLKAIHSPWQLREIMVEFWHNHFAVSGADEDMIALTFAAYDRDAIRPNVFGNFRVMLEAVAKSPAMLYYLDNAFNLAGPANENYARELFELHTLGEENYLNDQYETWDKVPGALEGKAIGYIDEDVYEAARAFTGWTVGVNPHQSLSIPTTGEFYYYDNWHDHYQKRVMGIDFPGHQGPMADGYKVLDILAAHEGTARFVCKKICKWLVSDNPSKSVVQKAVDTWMAHRESTDQIARTLRTILLSPEFMEGLGSKIKRPNHLILSFARTTESNFVPNSSAYWWCHAMGYHQFSSPFPTGNPDDANAWLNSDIMLKRWLIFSTLDQLVKEDGYFSLDLALQIPESVRSVDDLIDLFSNKLWNGKVEPPVREELTRIFSKDLPTDSFAELRTQYPETFESKSLHLAGMLAMSPQFQIR